MSPPEEISPSALFGFSPVFVRKLSRPAHWDPSEEPMDCYRSTFHDSQGEISIWKLSCAEDVAKFAVGWNQAQPGRTPTMEMHLVGLKPEELEEFGLVPISSPDMDLGCHGAAILHFHVTDDSAKVCSLIEKCYAESRPRVKLQKSKLKKALAFVVSRGCPAVSPGPCDCPLVC